MYLPLSDPDVLDSDGLLKNDFINFFKKFFLTGVNIKKLGVRTLNVNNYK